MGNSGSRPVGSFDETAAEVVEVQVGERDHGDRLRGHACGCERAAQRLHAVHAVHGALAWREALAKSGVEQHELAVCFQEQAVARQADAVVLVGSCDALPQDLGY